MANDRQDYVNKIIDAFQDMTKTTDHNLIINHLGLTGLYIDHLMDAQIDYTKKNKTTYEKPQDPTDIKSVLTAMLTASTKEQVRECNLFAKRIIYATASKQMKK